MSAQMNTQRSQHPVLRLVAGFGEAPWWAHLVVTIAASASVVCSASVRLIPYGAVGWTILLAILGFAFAAAGGVSRFTVEGNKAVAQPTAVLIGYFGVLWAGATPYIWWAWTERGSTNTLALLAAMSAAVGLLLATRSGLVIAVLGLLVLAGSSAVGGASRWSLGAVMVLALCAVASIGSLQTDLLQTDLLQTDLLQTDLLPGDSKATGIRAGTSTDLTGRWAHRSTVITQLRHLIRPTVLAVAVGCVLCGLILEGPMSSLLSRMSSSELTQRAGSSSVGSSSRGRQEQGNSLDSVFRPGKSGLSGALNSADSFAIDKFGAADTTEILRVRYITQAIGFGALGPILIRGQAFDSWDGRSWKSTSIEATRSAGTVLFDRIESDQKELLTTAAQIELLSGSTDLVFGESRIASLDLNVDSVQVSADDTIRSAIPMGKGSRYVVVSARHQWRDGGPPTPLVSLNDTEMLAKFGVRPEHLDVSALSPRTRQLALSLGNPALSIQEVERNIETWLAANTGYDFSARQKSTPGDVVDDFLFESQRGWCEQIATATVMLLRANGIPARLATGYLPSQNVGNATYVALSRDAHAWVEMYLPGRGWAPRDPTSAVPLVNAPPELKPTSERPLDWNWPDRKTVSLVAFSLAVGLAAWLVLRRVSGLRRRSSWYETQVRSLETFGVRHGVKRTPDQTLREFGEALRAEAVPDDRVRAVVLLLDRHRYAPTDDQPTSADQTWVESSLRELEAQHQSASNGRARKLKRSAGNRFRR
jgi:transglutaminase-like putative cysteine protease